MIAENKKNATDIVIFITISAAFFPGRAENSGNRGIPAVYQKNSQRYQDQGGQTVEAEGLVVFSQQKGGEDHAEYRIHKSEDGNPADGIIFQQDPPETVGHGRDHSHIKQKQGGGNGKTADPPAHGGSSGSQNQTAQDKLPAAEHHRIFSGRKFFYQNGGQGIGQSGDEDKTFPGEPHMEIKGSSGQ